MRYFYKDLKLSTNRDDMIIEICRNKRVLHIGAADSPYTREKYEKNLLLHKKLSLVTTDLLGIDTDAESSDWLNKKGLPEIRIVNMNSVSDLGFRPQVIIFGETIEHITNIGSCLETLKLCMDEETKLIISTPNCYALRFFSMVLRMRETIHDDHKVGFSYGLLHQLLKSHGLRVEDFYFTFLPRDHYPLWRKIWILSSKMRSGFAETLLAICRLEVDRTHPTKSLPGKTTKNALITNCTHENQIKIPGEDSQSSKPRSSTHQAL